MKLWRWVMWVEKNGPHAAEAIMYGVWQCEISIKYAWGLTAHPISRPAPAIVEANEWQCPFSEYGGEA